MSTLGPEQCLFGDILNLLPDDLRKKIFLPRVERVEISSDDVNRSLKGKHIDTLFTKQGRLKCSLGGAARDWKLHFEVPAGHDQEARPVCFKVPPADCFLT